MQGDDSNGEMKYKDILEQLKALSNPEAVAGMARYGINPSNAYGVSIPNLRTMAKKIGINHALAQRLWASGIHEAKILAGMVDDPTMVTEEQAEQWVADFDSWDICDQCCLNLLKNTKFPYKKALQWSARKEELVKRAGFALMACLAVKDKTTDDKTFEAFLAVIGREAVDETNYVKKAVNWALRQIGKRNLYLNKKAIDAASGIAKLDSKSARWIASDALRELTSQAVQQRLKNRSRVYPGETVV